jgi:phage tail sheath protein FI
VTVLSPGRNFVRRVADFQPGQVLRPVHRAVMRMAAARGDLLAVLALPEHFRTQDAATHVAWLRSSEGDESTWSYAALYHPWLITDDDPGAGALRGLPPDGAACGTAAQRALGRGAWIAPANQPMRGVVELTPSIPRDEWIRFADTQVNLLRDEPHGIVAQSADTLARDPDLAPIHVRRLLILLRRLALRVGPGYVFEPNNDAFERLVQRGFEAVLENLFARGAFAGAQREAAYQLVVGAEAGVADQGRFVVEIKVAPSQPMSFLTVRLIQSGDRGVVTEVR